MAGTVSPEAMFEWPGGGLMCRGTGLTLRHKSAACSTPRPSDEERKRLAEFYGDYLDSPCPKCTHESP
jgi:hypothetical protein